MALTTTTLNGTITAGAKLITLTAYTNPQVGPIGPGVILQFATGETCTVTSALLAPTLEVVRGDLGTLAQAHTTGEGITYGLDSDAAWPAAPARIVSAPVQTMQAQEITATGATGSTAAVVTPASFAFLNATGVSGTGLNLPVPAVGNAYWVRNNGTGAINVYCVGGSINGTTGTTAYAITATGDLGAAFMCATAGAWRAVPNAT